MKKETKKIVETVREIGSLTCALYIRNSKRILKRYPEI